MSANVDVDIDKIGTKLVEPIEKGPDKEAVSGENSSVSLFSPPFHRLNTTDDSVPKDASSSHRVDDLTTGGKQTPAVGAPEEENSPNIDENSSVQNEILNKLPNECDDDQCSSDSLIFKIADSVISTAGASADTKSGSFESRLATKKKSPERNSDEFDCSSTSADSSLSAISIYDTSSDSCLDVHLKRRSSNETSSVDVKKFKVDGLSPEDKKNCTDLEALSCATEKDSPKFSKPVETPDSSAAKTNHSKSLEGLENSVSGIQNCSTLFQIEGIVTETEVPPPGDLSMLSNFELGDSNNSFPETLLEGVHVSSPVFGADPAEESENLNISSEDSSSSKMKGEVVAAPMPIPETRSPMIHIPASIVNEFMNSESSLSPVIAKSAKKNTSPLHAYLDEFAKSNDGSSGETTVVNGSSKPVGIPEKSQEEAVDLKDGERISSAPLIGSIPPDSGPAKPASPAALSNPPMSASSSQSDATDKMDVSNDLDSLEKPATYQLTNGSYGSASLCASSDPLGDISSFGSSTVSDDPMSRTLLTPLSGTIATPVLLADDELPQSTDITELAPVKTSYASSSCSTASTSTNLDNAMNSTKLLDVRNTASPGAVEVSESNKNLKRSLPAEEDQNNKKLRLSPETENTSTSTGISAIEDDASKALVEAEVEKLKHTASKLRKLKRKDLESMVLDLFMNKVLHNHELGKYKTLCEKLESTLESNRKKAAQYHKELDDLRKVTRKLQEEHQNRKDHLVTPIKIKRSVGIQAAPHIIQKGIAAACGESGRTQGRSLPTQNNGGSPHQSMLVIGNSSVGTSGSPHNSVMRTSFGGGRMVSTPNVSQGDRRGPSQPLTSQMNSSKSNAVIDLTDEEESRTSTTVTSASSQVSKTLQNLAKVTAASGFVSLPTSGAAQYVLVPSSAAGGGNTVVVAATNMATNSLTGSSNSSARLLLPSSPSVMTPKTTSALLAPPTSVMSQQQSSPHPAPLPRTAPQQVVGGAKQLPPQPTLKLSHKDNSIVLSWTMAKTSEHEAIASYQLFAYQESNQPPSPSLWKKVGSVKALELPMACTLTQFMPGHRYHFAVRAVDAKSRLGPFSDPRSIRLEK